MSSGIVKRARGRPVKALTKETPIVVEEKKQVLTVTKGFNRRAGSMSLRPNKRVKIAPEEFITGDIEHEDSDNDQTVDVRALDDESDEEIYDDFEGDTKSSFFESSPVTLDESELQELSNRDAFQDENQIKRSRKKIMYNAKLAAQKRREQLLTSVKSDANGSGNKTNVLQTNYIENKEWMCVACSNEIDIRKLARCEDIFTGLSRRGKSLKDLLSSVIKENIDESMVGRKICTSCHDSLNQIEHFYAAFRKAADNFLDKYLLGQKAMDADLAGVQQINDLTVLHGSWNLSLNEIIIKVFDNNVDTFNAYMYGHQDFNMSPLRMYNGSVQSETSIPAPEPKDENQMVVTFDFATGQICHTENYAKAQIEAGHIVDRDSGAILYLTEKEFDEIKKVHAEEKIFISIEEFGRLNPIVILGQKASFLQMLLSPVLTSRYRQQIPGAQNAFCCCDCGASFHHLHMLANHIQSAHVAQEDQTNSNGDVEAFNEIVPIAPNPEDPTRTGEVPSLEKPFQCEHCDKCFSDYHNFSNHVEHYHGFNRKCNVAGCDFNARSIQEFVQHYVRHTEPNFVLPTEFKEKTQISLPCPGCNASMNGIWRFYNHTFIHDPLPRFKCPVCTKRLAKVQNFKLHLIKHVTPPNQKTKICKHCNQLVPLAIFAKHLQEMHETAVQYACNQCPATFSREVHLKFHMEKHIPKANWVWFCKMCSQAFPSETRMKSHETNSHQNDPVICRHCDHVGFASRTDLKEHINTSHQRLFGCSICGVKEMSVSAAREHFRATHSDKPLKCHKCTSLFQSMIDVHAHVVASHGELLALSGENNDEFTCFTCGALLKTGKL